MPPRVPLPPPLPPTAATFAVAVAGFAAAACASDAAVDVFRVTGAADIAAVVAAVDRHSIAAPAADAHPLPHAPFTPLLKRRDGQIDICSRPCAHCVSHFLGSSSPHTHAPLFLGSSTLANFQVWWGGYRHTRVDWQRERYYVING